MKKIFEKALGYIVCIIMFAAITTVAYYTEKWKQRPLEKKIQDLELQLAAAKVPLKNDTIRDSILVQSQQVIEIDKTDYQKQLADEQLIKDLQLKVSQVVSENRMLRETRDTVYLQKESDSVFSYHDRWADFEYLVPRQLLKYAVRDSLNSNVSRIYKHRFLWWRWGTKGYQVKYVNFNPNVEIRYNQYIMVKE